MGGGILGTLLKKADSSIYNGLGKTVSPAVFKQRSMQRMGNIDDMFTHQDPKKLLGRNNIKIRNSGGGGTPMLQDIYAQLTKRK